MPSASLRFPSFNKSPLASAANTTSRAAPKSPPSNLAKSLTLAAMSLGYAVVQLDVTIVNTAINSIGASLGGGVSQLQWVVSAYTIAFAAFILTAGALGDRIGAKRVFMAGFAIFIAASVGCALTPTAVLLIAARAVQGLGAAILVPNSLALLNHAYPDEKQRGRAVGIWAAGASVALISGPLLGGGLIALAGWLAIDFPRQSAARSGRAVADLALRQRDHAISAARNRFAGPGRGDRGTRLSRRRDHRRRHAWLDSCFRDWRLRCIGGPGDPVRVAGTARAATDAAAVAFQTSDVRADVAGRASRQHRLLRTDLRPQSLFPAGQRVVAVRDRAGVPADAGRGAAGQPDRSARDRAHRRARDHRRRRCAGSIGMSGAARDRARHQLLENRGAAHDHRRRPWPAGAAAHLNAARQRREAALRHRRRRPQLDASDRQRAGRRAVRLAGGSGKRFHAGRA
jgi:hypothetical protein